MNFHVGQKVVCVDNGFMVSSRGILVDAPELEKGKVYTIKDTGGYWVILDEVSATQGYYSFHARRFRPIVERKTDISVFTAMLNTAKDKVRA